MPSGKVYKYGDNVDTDVIIPARYLNAPSPDELAKHCMEDIDATFAQKVQPGDIIVGGANFGCGSSREHAPIAIARAASPASLRRASRAFSTATPSTSASRFWNAPKRRRRLQTATKYRLILPPAPSPMKRPGKHTTRRLSRPLSRRLLRTVDFSPI